MSAVHGAGIGNPTTTLDRIDGVGHQRLAADHRQDIALLHRQVDAFEQQQCRTACERSRCRYRGPAPCPSSRQVSARSSSGSRGFRVPADAPYINPTGVDDIIVTGGFLLHLHAAPATHRYHIRVAASVRSPIMCNGSCVLTREGKQQITDWKGTRAVSKVPGHVRPSGNP